MRRKPVESIQIGDVILPPEREMRLWMRRRLTENNLPESALYLTVTKVYEGAPDKRGRWIVIEGQHTPEWIGKGRIRSMTIKAQPHTQWPVVDHSEPTYSNQLWHARKLLAEKGAEALNNPHAMIGRTCKCGTCFCCAALQVYNESRA